MADPKWEDIIPHPSVAAIVGGRGKGKSGLGYFLVEYLSQMRQLQPAIVGLPEEKAHLLPPNFKVCGIENLPEDSIIFIDEAGMQFHSRMSMSKSNIMMDKLVSISRQKRQTIIIASHNLRKLDIALVGDVSALLCKEPSLLHSRFDRSEIRRLIEEASVAFKRKTALERKRFTYVISDTFDGMLENPLPLFWTQELSEAYKGVSVKNGKPIMSDDEWVAMKRSEVVVTEGVKMECMICHKPFNTLICGTCESCFREWVLSNRKTEGEPRWKLK